MKIYRGLWGWLREWFTVCLQNGVVRNI
jgi:hypothetical protein